MLSYRGHVLHLGTRTGLCTTEWAATTPASYDPVSPDLFKVQSFMLTEVRDCDLLIVITSSTFLKRKDTLKEKSS